MMYYDGGLILGQSANSTRFSINRPTWETREVVNACAKYGDIRGYERLKDYYTREKMEYLLVTFNHERDVDAAVKGLRHKKK